MKEHKNAKLFRWIADGEDVQYKSFFSQAWEPLSNNTTVLCNAYLGVDFEFRLAPRSIMCNGVEVPAPEKDAPKDGATYYIPDFGEQLQYYDITWCDDEIDLRFLERGLVYLNKEDAIDRAKAMLIVKEK